MTCAYAFSWHWVWWGWVRTPEVAEGEPTDVPSCLPCRISEAKTKIFTSIKLALSPANCLSSSYAGIEDLRDKREEINKQICKEEDEKAKVQNDLTVLSKRLTTLNDSIARKVRIHPITSPRGGFLFSVLQFQATPHVVGAETTWNRGADPLISCCRAVPRPRLRREVIMTRPFKRLRRPISRFSRVRRRCSRC